MSDKKSPPKPSTEEDTQGQFGFEFSNPFEALTDMFVDPKIFTGKKEVVADADASGKTPSAKDATKRESAPAFTINNIFRNWPGNGPKRGANLPPPAKKEGKAGGSEKPSEDGGTDNSSDDESTGA